MEWDKNSSLQLIEEYKENRCLWDPNCNEYKNIEKREDAWRNIAEVMNRDAGIIKKKMDSLLASYRRERQKCFLNSKKSGCEAVDSYKPKWFAYDNMNFLLAKYKPRPSYNTIKTIDSSEPEDVTEHLLMTISTDDDDNNQQSTSTSMVKEFKSLQKKPLLKREIIEEPRMDEEDKILITTLNGEKDVSSVFGEYVATKHRKYSAYTKSIVEHLINNILYAADVGKYDDPQKHGQS